MTAVLREVLGAIERHRPSRPVVIFDLDGTLYDNRPRTLRILHAFAAALPSKHLADAQRIRRVSAQDLCYRLDETLLPRGVSPEVLALANETWQKKFFTDAASADDVPHRGAVYFVRECYARGATVVYLTGRDIPGMLVGTVRTLRDDGFPIGLPRVELVMKPSFDHDDVAFKLSQLDPMDELGRVVATFENEPGNCNFFHRRWPDAPAILLDTQHAPEAPPLDPGCHVLRDFELD